MGQATAPAGTAVERDEIPPDLETMRGTAGRLLGPDDGPDALPPAPSEVDILTRTLRGHIELLAPEVERAAAKPATIPQYCALACVGEARGKLRAQPGTGAYGAVAYARRLARVLLALCDHFEKLDGETR